MTPEELADKMVKCIRQDNNIEFNKHIPGNDLMSQLAVAVTPAITCNWTDENIITFCTGEEDKADAIMNIIPNGKEIDEVLSAIFEVL